MRALLIWGGFILCLLLVTATPTDHSQDGPKSRDGRGQESPAASPRPASRKRKTQPGRYSALFISNDEPDEDRSRPRKSKEPHHNREKKKKQQGNIQIGRSLLPPPEDMELPRIPSCHSPETPNHMEEKRSKGQRNGRRRGEERRGRKQEEECQPKEDEPTIAEMPEFSLGEVKKKRRHGGKDRQKKMWRSGSRSAIASVWDGDRDTEIKLGKEQVRV